MLYLNEFKQPAAKNDNQRLPPHRCTLLEPLSTKRDAIDALIKAHHKQLHSVINAITSFPPPTPSPRERVDVAGEGLVFTVDSHGALLLDDAISVSSSVGQCR